MQENDYLALLKKARTSLPENVHNKERWKLPKLEVIVEGRFTILRNLKQLLEATRREEAHMTKFILSQLGTAGAVENERLVFTGRVSESKVQAVLDDYVETYVRCEECGAPDTHLERTDRVQVLKCEACGAHKPVRAKKARRPEAAVREGGIYQVRLTQPGQRGEAKGPYEGYMMIVPGGQVGVTANVRVTKISGKIAFCEVTQQQAA